MPLDSIPSFVPTLPQPVKSAPPQSRYYVPALDGLRVLAFLGVFACHAGPLHPRLFGHPTVQALLSVGSFGVPLFFVLSAFLITKLLLMERERTGRVDLRAYYVRRVLRIWPLYFLVVAVGLLAFHRMGGDIRGSISPLFSFTANFAQGGGRLAPTLSHLWSLSIEEQFYLVWPVALALLSRRALTNLCFTMVAIAFVSRLAIGGLTGSWSVAYTATTSHFDSLALGTLVALNVDRLKAFSKVQGLGLMALCVLGMAAVPLAFPASGASPTGALVAYSAVPFFCAAIVALAIGTRGTFLARPRMAAFGRLTFGLYMWHLVALVALHPVGFVQIAACFVGTVAVAAASYYGFERPFLSLKHRFERVSTHLAA